MTKQYYLAAATGETLDSKVSGRCGHARFFLLVNPDRMEAESIRGTEKDARHRIEEILSPAVSRIIVGNIGPALFQRLTTSGCIVFLCRNMSVRDAIEKVSGGQIPPLNAPTLKESIHSGRKIDNGPHGHECRNIKKGHDAGRQGKKRRRNGQSGHYPRFSKKR